MADALATGRLLAYIADEDGPRLELTILVVGRAKQI